MLFGKGLGTEPPGSPDAVGSPVQGCPNPTPAQTHFRWRQWQPLLLLLFLGWGCFRRLVLFRLYRLISPRLNSSPLICTPPPLLYVLELRAGARRRAKLEASRLGVHGLSTVLTQASRLKLSSLHHGSDLITEAQAQKEGLPIREALCPPPEVSSQERKDLASEF